jgi:hypothetical protein
MECHTQSIRHQRPAGCLPNTFVNDQAHTRCRPFSRTKARNENGRSADQSGPNEQEINCKASLQPNRAKKTPNARPRHRRHHSPILRYTFIVSVAELAIFFDLLAISPKPDRCVPSKAWLFQIACKRDPYYFNSVLLHKQNQAINSILFPANDQRTRKRMHARALKSHKTFNESEQTLVL